MSPQPILLNDNIFLNYLNTHLADSLRAERKYSLISYFTDLQIFLSKHYNYKISIQKYNFRSVHAKLEIGRVISNR